MIKNISLLLLILIISSNVRAQIFQNVSFKAGYVSSDVSYSINNETLETFESKGGVFLSISKEFLLSDIFSIKPYLGYYQKGFNENWLETNENGEIVKEILAKTYLDYISLIFTATIKYDNPIITPYISIGPRLDFLINKKNGMIEFTNVSIESFWADRVSKWSYGASIIVGVDYKIADDLSLILEGSYNPDISDLLRDSAFKDFMKMKNNTFDIGV